MEVKLSSVFTKILNGELPSYKIHEDELTFSILAVPANQLGHVLVIPKEEVDHFTDVPFETYQRVMDNAYKIGKALKSATGCKRVGTIIQGFEVPHFHYHLVPVNAPDELDFKNARQFSKDEMENIQKRITEELSS